MKQESKEYLLERLQEGILILSAKSPLADGGHDSEEDFLQRSYSLVSEAAEPETAANKIWNSLRDMEDLQIEFMNSKFQRMLGDPQGRITKKTNMSNYKIIEKLLNMELLEEQVDYNSQI